MSLVAVRLNLDAANLLIHWVAPKVQVAANVKVDPLAEPEHAVLVNLH